MFCLFCFAVRLKWRIEDKGCFASVTVYMLPVRLFIDCYTYKTHGKRTNENTLSIDINVLKIRGLNLV